MPTGSDITRIHRHFPEISLTYYHKEMLDNGSLSSEERFRATTEDGGQIYSKEVRVENGIQSYFKESGEFTNKVQDRVRDLGSTRAGLIHNLIQTEDERPSREDSDE